MVVYTNNGYPSLTDDGKVRTCCCGCASFEFTVLMTYDGGSISGTSGNHTLAESIVAGATGCGPLSWYFSENTLALLAAHSVEKRSCDGPCGESYAQKTASYIYGKFRYPYFTNPATMAATVGYECNRLFSYTRRPSVNLRVSQLVVSGLGGRTIHVRYRRTGYDAGTTPWLDTAADGTYADPTGSTVFEGGTSGTNTNLYVEFYFT